MTHQAHLVEPQPEKGSEPFFWTNPGLSDIKQRGQYPKFMTLNLKGATASDALETAKDAAEDAVDEVDKD